MSQVKTDRIWQHNTVLPYILHELRQKIEAITPIHKIYLTGSRARTPVANWGALEGKDWDILVVCDFPIINTVVWTEDMNYHIDLVITNRAKAEALLHNAQRAIELYPDNQLVI
jgi:predicted nucleotidyltransferase